MAAVQGRRGGGAPGAQPETARLLRDEFVKHYQKNCPTAVSCFLDDFEACIAHLVFPVTHRKAIRSTNLQTEAAMRMVNEIAHRTAVSQDAARRRIMNSLGAVPLGRPNRPEEVAELAAVLASITGSAYAFLPRSPIPSRHGGCLVASFVSIAC